MTKYPDQEEAGIDAELEPSGVLFFQLAGYDFAHKVYIFRTSTYTGEITECVQDSVTHDHPPPFDDVPLTDPKK